SSNPADIQERLATMESQLAPIGSALTEKDLAFYMDYLTLAQEAYQRPSTEYQAIWDLVMSAFEAVLGGFDQYDTGGYVARTGPAIVHQGEHVSRPGENGGEQHFHFNIPITVNGAQDPRDTSRKIEEDLTRFFQGKGRRMIQGAAGGH
ncbi:unnamed protein product, partial [marine sediment metagenome]